MEDVAEAVIGWAEEVGPDSDLTANVLSNRLERTGWQLMGEKEETPPGRVASFMAVVAAADTFGAHLRFQRGDAEGVRQALGRGGGICHRDPERHPRPAHRHRRRAGGAGGVSTGGGRPRPGRLESAGPIRTSAARRRRRS